MTSLPSVRRSGRAVSAAEAEPYAGKLLRLPRFVREGGPADWRDIVDGLALTGHFLMRDVLTDRAAPVGEARGSAGRAACAAPRGDRLAAHCAAAGAVLASSCRRRRTDTLALLFPNVATTKGISVRVSVSYLAEQSAPASGRWFWSYHVRIENGSKRSVQLLSRSWHILDGRGTLHEVRGEGVVGRNAADRARRQLRLCLGLSAQHADRVDERKLSHDR